MKEYIISISATVFLTSVITIILPTGKTSKFIKAILSFFIVFVIISPLINVKNNGFGILTYSEEISFDNDYLDYIANLKSVSAKSQINSILEENGVKNGEIEVIYEIDDEYKFNLIKIEINLKNSVIFNENENIDIIQIIKNSISSSLIIDEKDICIYE